MAEVLGHGSVGKHEQGFTQLLGLRDIAYDVTQLAALAKGMQGILDGLSDGSDPEENLYVPAGYTYFGQFIDHDLTFDTTSTLSLDPRDLADPNQGPSNIRSPRFDLDCVYGNGPGDAPYMYFGEDGVSRGTPAYQGASLLLGGDAGSVEAANGTSVDNPWDLLRGPNGRALIGDKRNDENSIVNQIQQLFIAFHNKVVATLAVQDPTLLDDRGKLFNQARDQVRWSYHRILIEDFLPRIVDSAVLDRFTQRRAAVGDDAYRLYKRGAMRANLPREFVAAAYRYGHSGVRQGYRLNTTTIRSIFTPDLPGQEKNVESLVGFEPLLKTHVIDDWARLFPLADPLPGMRLLSNADVSVDVDDPFATDAQGNAPGLPGVRLQYAYKLDPSLVDPLTNLPSRIASQGDVQPPALREPPPHGPSLALLNLLRGNRYGIRGGQAFAPLVGASLDPEKYLRVRTLAGEAEDGSKLYTFKHIRELDAGGCPLGDAFTHDTPLWFYILAEAQKPVVDLWHDQGKTPLTEAQLMAQGPDGKALPDVDPADPQAVLAQLMAARAGGTRLGPVGGGIVAEVFYGLLDSDSDSLFNRAPGGAQGWTPPWAATLGAGRATMAKLVRFAATPQNGLTLSAIPPASP